MVGILSTPYMKIIQNIKQSLVLSCAVAAFALGSQSAMAAEEFSFDVHNKTEEKIVKILVSQDKKTWGEFDIGKGIAAGKNVTLVWDKSTENEKCKQWVKAVYAGGDESEPAKFDFCEEDLEIEFEE